MNTRWAAHARSEDHHLSCKGLIENTLAIMLGVYQLTPAYVSSAVLAIPPRPRSGYGRVRGLCATCTWLRGCADPTVCAVFVLGWLVG